MNAKSNRGARGTSGRRVPSGRIATSRTSKGARAAPALTSASELRGRLGLTRPVFARLVGVSERTVADWERASTPGASAKRALNELGSVVLACERVMKPESVGPWLVTANESLAGFKPIELIERGETERVLRALFFVEAGIPL